MTTNPRVRWLALLFCACYTFFHIHSSFLNFILCFFFLFHSCSHAGVFGKTVVHKRHIYCKTRWSLLRPKIHLSTTNYSNNWDRLSVFCVHLSIFLYSLIFACLCLVFSFYSICSHMLVLGTTIVRPIQVSLLL